MWTTEAVKNLENIFKYWKEISFLFIDVILLNASYTWAFKSRK